MRAKNSFLLKTIVMTSWMLHGRSQMCFINVFRLYYILKDAFCALFYRISAKIGWADIQDMFARKESRCAVSLCATQMVIQPCLRRQYVSGEFLRFPSATQMRQMNDLRRYLTMRL